MNILFITTRNPYELSEQDGGHTFAAQFIDKFSESDCLEVLFIRESSGTLWHGADRHLTHVLEPRSDIADRFERRINTADRLARWIANNHDRFAVIVAQHVSSAFGVALLNEEIKRKLVIFPMFTCTAYQRSGERPPEEYFAQERLAITQAAAIVCPSDAEILDIRKEYQVAPNRFYRIPFAIDLEVFRFSKRTLCDSQPTVLSIGTIKPQKNQFEWIEIADALNVRGFSFKILLVGSVGDEGYFEKLSRAIAQRKLQNQVVMCGVLTNRQIVEVAKGCTLAASTSHWETFGMAIFESLAMGLPTLVYSDISCFAEYLDKRSSCIGVPRCATSMADAIIEVHSNSQRYDELNAGARNSVLDMTKSNVGNLQRFALETVANKTKAGTAPECQSA